MDASRSATTLTRVSVKQVRDSLNQTVRDQATVKYFGRPMANLLTPFFFNRGWSANGVTYLCVGLSTCALLLLLWPNPITYAAAAALFYLVFVLDCVDGNLARLSGTVTYYGKFIDGLSDAVFVFLAPLFVGIGVFTAGGPPAWLMVGSLIAATTLATQMIRSRYSFFREWATSQSGPLSVDETRRLATPLRIERAAAFVFVNGNFIAPLLLPFPWIGSDGYLISLASFVPLANVIWTTAVLWQASVLLRRPRRSIHAA